MQYGSYPSHFMIQLLPTCRSLWVQIFIFREIKYVKRLDPVVFRRVRPRGVLWGTPGRKSDKSALRILFSRTNYGWGTLSDPLFWQNPALQNLENAKFHIFGLRTLQLHLFPIVLCAKITYASSLIHPYHLRRP